MAYIGGECEKIPGMTLMATRPSLTERLKQQRKDLAQKVAELDSAIAAIEANPNVQEVLDALSKMGEIR